MDKIDFLKNDRRLYGPKDEPELVEVPAMKYLMYDGQGIPEGNPEFQRAFQALYGIAYTLKFMPKKGNTPPGWQDFKVPPPEGLWWTRSGKPFSPDRPDDWVWTLMVRVPDFVTPKLVRLAMAELVAKKKDDVYVNVRLESLDEGRAVQMMHIGPYETETADIARMNAFTEAGGFRYTGKHHEIYFGDPRRTKPEKLRTLLRHPVVPS